MNKSKRSYTQPRRYYRQKQKFFANLKNRSTNSDEKSKEGFIFRMGNVSFVKERTQNPLQGSHFQNGNKLITIFKAKSKYYFLKFYVKTSMTKLKTVRETSKLVKKRLKRKEVKAFQLYRN